MYDADKNKFLYDEQSLKLKRSLENSRLQFALSSEQAKRAPIQLNSAQTSYNQAKARYESGLSSMPELVQSFYLLNRAEVDMSIATNNVWKALLMKTASSGDISLFMNQVNKLCS